jgi:hypothetical protein
MLSPEESRRVLRHLLRERQIADLPLLLKALQTEAPRSVFRRLSLLGYVSSYNQNGRFYTLSDIPEFDAHGLWQHQGVFFSRQGTLNATIAHLVEVAEGGHTHSELEAILRVRVHNMLLDLVRRGRIHRELLAGLFLYVSADRGRAAAQVSRRRQQAEAAAPQAVTPGSSLEIEVLLEVIHGARTIPTPELIVKRLAARAVQVTQEQVEAIFQKHGLKKTPNSGSRSCRR